MKLSIITRCSRLNNLRKVKDSIFTTDKFDITWYVMFDSTVLKDVDAEILAEIQEKQSKIFFIKSIPGDFGHQMINKAISDIQEGFIFVLDDDNIIHEDFYENLYTSIRNNPDKRGFVFNQRIDGKDFTGQEIRYCAPERMKVSQVDMAQVVFERGLIGDIRLNPMNYIADSIYIEEVYNRSNPDDFYFINTIMCYYNYLQGKRGASVPKILYIGEGQPEIKSNQRAWWESDALDILYRSDDTSLNKDIYNFDPDFIVTVGNKENKNLVNSNLDIKKRWINLNSLDQIGEIVYNSSMNYILENNNKKLVSFFTPIYNITDKLVRLYESIAAQTHTNWEWVLVNDSSDGGKTLKVAEGLAAKDPRVKVYDFREKSKGIIGESKYRAAMLCKGYILAELDHDDYITPDSAELLLKAFDKYPDAGFVYTDCVEITEDWKTLTYGDGFCFGYGKYRKEMHMGIEMDVNESPNINPKTIRHIVGIPNHIRCWKRETYLKIGGHNRRLSIADDYELIIRTFLETKFVRIVKNCYLQFIYNSTASSNTHELSRADIQRRVRSIADFYNYKIYKRFEELGIEDWAYKGNQANPLLVPSRFGDEEGSVNYTYYPENQSVSNDGLVL
jgi:glycosyltransferase involved in cell wall biosynthesis